jgi:hypothetical protein
MKYHATEYINDWPKMRYTITFDTWDDVEDHFGYDIAHMNFGCSKGSLCPNKVDWLIFRGENEAYSEEGVQEFTITKEEGDEDHEYEVMVTYFVTKERILTVNASTEDEAEELAQDVIRDMDYCSEDLDIAHQDYDISSINLVIKD